VSPSVAYQVNIATHLAEPTTISYNMPMAIVGILMWWYSAGFRQAIRSVQARLMSMLDYFSIDLLLRTLFSPFRQISAGSVDGPLPLQLRAFVDRLVSRLVGAVVRSIVMVVGIMAILLTVAFGLFYLVFWLSAPLLPLVGLIMMMTGWVPWTIL
jgi:hypothetical protein